MPSASVSQIIIKLSKLFSSRSKEDIYEYVEQTPRNELISDLEQLVSSQEGVKKLQKDVSFSTPFYDLLSSLLLIIQTKETQENSKVKSPFSTEFYRNINTIIKLPEDSSDEYIYK